MFSRDKAAKTGRQSWCKLCKAEALDPVATNVAKTIWAQAHPDKMREYRRKYNNPMPDEYADVIPV